MRRAGWICLSAVLVVLLSCMRVSAAGGITCNYTPRTEKGTVFYIDVSADSDISAAVIELRYDTDKAALRSVAAAEETSFVRQRSQDGCVRIAFADSGAVRGMLFRVAFKATAAGECTFTLHTVQAVDSGLHDVGRLKDDTLTVTLGKKDVEAAASDTEKVDSSSAGKSVSGKAELTSQADDAADQDADKAAVPADLQTENAAKAPAADLSADRRWTFFALGAVAAALTAALVLLGYLIGRKAHGGEKPSGGAQNAQAPAADEGLTSPDDLEKTAENSPELPEDPVG